MEHEREAAWLPVPGEVVLVTRPAHDADAHPRPHPIETLREILGSTVGQAAYTATTLASLVQQTVTYTVSSTVNAVLDRTVPAVTDAIIARIDLTELVLDQVDLRPIVLRALDEIDLTAIVLDRVDINAIVAAADIEDIIDRVPIVPIANYVIDEIDLPQIIRQSTGGIATEAINATRVQGVGADQFIAHLADRILHRRKPRDLDAPGDPESLLAEVSAQAQSVPEREDVDYT